MESGLPKASKRGLEHRPRSGTLSLAERRFAIGPCHFAEWRGSRILDQEEGAFTTSGRSEFGNFFSVFNERTERESSEFPLRYLLV
jgi:hypothetical protein